MSPDRAPRIRIDPALARSWLLVSGARPEAFGEAAASGADAVVLDVEDAVAAADKAQARDAVVRWLRRGTGSAWVRVNDATTEHWEHDLEALGGLPVGAGVAGTAGLAGVMLAKAESAEQVAATAARLPAGTPVVALIESAAGLEAAVAVAAEPATFRLAFGSGDFRRDTGMSASDLAMAYPRSRLVLASRLAQLPGPIDGPSLSDDPVLVHESAALSASLGLTGKLCLKPAQAEPVNAALSPSADELAWASGVIADFAARGGVLRDGSDLPRLARARTLEHQAAALGLAAPRRPVEHDRRVLEKKS
ncbi:aldolase/citrate lyase family protein [Herbiconiux sp. 11R-BC]|uniref:HpcH/HpaI aldolase/citrate lyase family protein n=1 Tax=Herbiconiux sp. 11R-BC TaxID=3111637 RepID=UPI003BFF258B